MLYKELIAVCSQIHTKHIKHCVGRTKNCWMLNLVVHITGLQIVKSHYKTSQLILYRKIITVFSQIHTKHINTQCGQNVELLYVKMVAHIHVVTTGVYSVKSLI
jgi:hypothetical protein